MPPIAAVRRPLLLLLALACLLIGAAGARAQTHRSAACTSGRVHASHACAKRSHASHPRRSSHRVAKHHARHGKGKGKAGGPAPQHQSETTPAVCDDGSAPSSSGQGAFTCDDGSEPACENGSEPASTSSGAKLVCAPDPDTGPSFGEECETDSEGGCSTPMPPICEDGSAPIWSKQGYYDCRYGEPTCETGSEPTFSSNGTILYCEAAESGEES